MNKALVTLAVCYISMIAIIDVAYASDTKQCDIQLGSAVRITADTIEVTGSDSTVMQVFNEGNLRISNMPVSLTDAQRQLVMAYSTQVRETVPAIVDIALEGVELGLTAASEVFYGLLGPEPPASLTNALDRIKTQIDQQVSRGGGTVYLDAGGLSDLDSFMEKLEPEIESVIAASIGEVFANFGNSLQAEDANLMQSVASLVERMDASAKKLEARLHQQAKTLKTKAGGLCQQLTDLQTAELRLQNVIPAAKPFDLVEPQATLL
jgi:hypothetical protein